MLIDIHRAIFLWKKILTFSICLITILAFIWKMGMIKSIPDFGVGLASSIIDSTKNTGVSEIRDSTDIMHLPKPNIKINTDSFQTFMESPIPVLYLLAGFGGLTVLGLMLKTTVWILRKTPK